jgi:thiaminase
MTIAPTANSAEVVSLGLPAINKDANLIMETARRHGIDLDSGPGPTTVSFVSYMQALLPQGYPTALAAYYMSQRVYYEGWSAVRDTADRTTAYWPFIDSWSSLVYAKMTSSLARLVNTAAPRGPSPGMLLAAKRVIRFELSFWNAIYGGETW